MSIITLSIDPFNLQAFRSQLDILEGKFANFWASTEYPARIISTTRRFSFTTKRQELRNATNPLDDVREMIEMMSTPKELKTFLKKREQTIKRAASLQTDHEDIHNLIDLAIYGMADDEQLIALKQAGQRMAWRWRWLKNYRRLYEVLEQNQPPLGVNHYLLLYPNTYADPEAIRAVIKETFLIPDARIEPLPALFSGQYQAESTYLRPLDEGKPFLRVLHAYDVRGDWNIATFSSLLNTDSELALCIDVQTLSRVRALQKTQDAHTILNQAVHGRGAIKDAKSERALIDVNEAMQRLDQENLHEVAYLFLVQANNLKLLDRETQKLRDILGARMRLDVLAGGQHQFIHYFTATPTKSIEIPIPRRNALSSNIAAKTTWGIRKSDNLSGILWGHDYFEDMPIHYNLFGENGTDNPHMLMLGQAGSGKTVALMTLALRLAVSGVQVVFFDPVGKISWLCDAAGAGSSYAKISTNSSVNILDPIDRDIKTQFGHVVRKLAVILGKVSSDGTRTTYTPRDLNNFETGALDEAIQHERIYGKDGHKLATMTSTNAPLLSDLADILSTIEHIDGARRLAQEIMLKVSGVHKSTYNAPTTLKWDFSADVCGYDFLGVDKDLLPVIYDHAFSSLNAYVISEQRKRNRKPLAVIIDEYGFMAQIKALQSFVAMATKTWRNYVAAMISADQNAETYMGGGNANDFAAFTTNNTAVKFFGRQQGTDITLLRQAFGYLLSESDFQRLQTSTQGEFIAIFGNTVQRLKIELTGDERPMFIRSGFSNKKE